MVPNPSSEQLLNELAEEFSQRLRCGESPSIGEYSGRHPELAEEIEEFLESIALLEEMKGVAPTPRKRSTELNGAFGRYRIERTLGEGGMGTVYLAHDTQLDRKVALKTPKFSDSSDKNLIRRFYREAKSAATLRHPSICPVYDVGEIDGVHYISMAYIDGHSLAAYIKTGKATVIPAAVRLIAKVASALHEAHVHGVVHRDLKPANIMIDQRGEPVVMDFGLARQLGVDDAEPDCEADSDAHSDDTSKEAALTQDGTLLGSPGYMSPEQIRGESARIGPASDVYALGVVLFELLTGRLPHQGDGAVASIVRSVLNDEAPNASTIRSDVDGEISQICRQAMSMRIDDRYESMQDFSVALTQYLNQRDLNQRAEPGGEIELPPAGKLRSASIVRAKEQCELARSLYKEGQYAAATSILEKMVGDGQSKSNDYTQWAERELPDVRAKASQQVTALLEDGTTTRLELLQNDSPDRMADASQQIPTVVIDPTAIAPNRFRARRANPKWIYSLVPAICVGLLLTAYFMRSPEKARPDRAPGNDDFAAQSDGTPQTLNQIVAEPTPELMVGSEVTDEAAEEDASRPRDSLTAEEGRNVIGPAAQIMSRFDTDDDQKLSKDELRRIPPGLPNNMPGKRLAAEFDEHDRNADGFLDSSEIRAFMTKDVRNRGRGIGGFRPGGR